MFETVVFGGERAGVWRPDAAPETARLTIVIPGASRPGPGARRLLRPDQIDPTLAARREFGVPDRSITGPVRPGCAAADRMARMDLRRQRYAAAVADLMMWRHDLQQAGSGPELLAVLDARPEALAPAVPTPRPTATGLHHPSPENSLASVVLDGVIARRRLMATLVADEARDLELISRCYPGVTQFLPLEIGQALHLSDAAAGALIDRAQRLVRQLPATLNALHAGSLSVDGAEAILAATATTTPDISALVEAAVLPSAAGRTAEQIYRSCSYRVHRLDPDGARERHRAAVADRHISRRPLPDGMAALKLVASAQDVALMWETVTDLARTARCPGDSRTLGQLRVDCLVDVCSQWLADPDSSPFTPHGAARNPDHSAVTAPRSRRRRRRRRERSTATVLVTMPLTALLGGSQPADLDGHGPITADQARQIAAYADLYRIITDPITGTLLDHGHTRYRPPSALADHVITRDRTCAVPGCLAPARRCDLDHITPARPDPSTGRPTLGATDADNLAPLCRHHHLAKDGMGFTLVRHADGTYQLRTPLGRTTSRPPNQVADPENAEDQLERLESEFWKLVTTSASRDQRPPARISSPNTRDPPPF